MCLSIELNGGKSFYIILDDILIVIYSTLDAVV